MVRIVFEFLLILPQIHVLKSLEWDLIGDRTLAEVKVRYLGQAVIQVSI